MQQQVRRIPPPPSERAKHNPVSVTANGRKERLPYMSMYPGDILSDPDFVGMDLEARGAVWTLMLFQWQSDNDNLPAEPAAVCRLIGLPVERWPEIEAAVNRWFPLAGERRANGQLSAQRDQAAKKVATNRANALKGRSR